jgi:tetratricopeptide (TPR) repeat protein
MSVLNGRNLLRGALLIGACVPLLCEPAWAAQDEHAGHSAGQNSGSVHIPISCSQDAQRQFDRAVAILHSFFYPETVKAFSAIAQAEPSCAMAYWGVAISQRPNPLVPPFSHGALQAGWDAIEKARSARAPTQYERDWIETLSVFFEHYDTLDQKTRTAKYEAAMAKLHDRYPKDTEVAVFYALALNEAVDLADKSYSRQLKAAAILEQLAPALPDHPGIAHLLIHSYDYAPIAARGLPAARRYAALEPSAPHALHMPSHIFSTLGMWQDAVQADLASDGAAKAYAASVKPGSVVNPAADPARYHSLDFLTNAYLQLAQDKRAREIVDERNTVAELSRDYRYSGHTAFAAIPVRYAIERSAWAEAAVLQVPRTPYPQAEAITWFGRALGAARSGDLADARRDIDEIARLRDELASAHDAYWMEQLDVQAGAARAWIALGEGRVDEAIASMRAAADREDRTEKNVAMENRLSPMRELLGELLLEAGRPAEAQREFEASLTSVPNRFRSLAGAGRSAALAGHKAQARLHYEQLLVLARDSDSERPPLKAAREFLAKH